MNNPMTFPRKCVGLCALVIFLTTSIIANAEPGKGIPDQLEEIRATLASMQEMQALLDAKLDALQVSANQSGTKLDVLQSTASANGTKLDTALYDLSDIIGGVETVYESVNSTEVTTELCFQTGLGVANELGFDAEIGVGWPNVFHGKTNIKDQGGIVAGLGVGSDICIQIPLWSTYVPSNDEWISEIVKEQLDDLFSTMTTASQTVVPAMGYVYAATLPPPSAAIGVVGDLLAEPAAILDVNTFEPLIPPLMKEAIEEAPVIIAEAVIDPCGTLANAPLIGDVDPGLYNWMCPLSPQQTVNLLIGIDKGLNYFCHWVLDPLTLGALCG